jgi:hypothetical protein
VKAWNPYEITSLLEDVAITFSLIEKEFPLTFFDIINDAFIGACSR